MKQIWQLALLATLLWLLPLSNNARAAHITDVSDSFDYENKNPFDFRIQILYRFFQESATIAREKGVSTPDSQFFDYMPEFSAKHTRHVLLFNPKIGLYKDLELSLTIPLVLFESFFYQ